MALQMMRRAWRAAVLLGIFSCLPAGAQPDAASADTGSARGEALSFPDTMHQADSAEYGAALQGASSVRDTASRADSARREDALRLRDKVVRDAAPSIHRNKEISSRTLPRSVIRRVPVILGDPVRVLSSLPGVAQSNDASVKPLIRGGASHETRVFFDNVPLLQPYHFGSLFSLFNTESIEDLKLYTGAFPVSGRNALSGALFLTPRAAPQDSFRLYTDISFLRCNTFAGVPLLKDRLGVYASYQTIWYDFMVNRGFEALDWMVDEEDFTQSRREFQRYVDLPNFSDLQFGADLKATSDIDLKYNGLLSWDRFTVMDNRVAYFVDGGEVSEEFWERNFLFSDRPDVGRSIINMLDTLALVRVENDIHVLSGKWRLGEGYVLRASAARQAQRWYVDFYNNFNWVDTSRTVDRFEGYRDYDESELLFDLRRRVTSGQASLHYDGLRGHSLEAGAGYDFLEESFRTDLPGIMYEMIYNGNNDLVNSLGFYGAEGLVITRDPVLDLFQVDYFDRLTGQIYYKDKGRTWAGFHAAWLRDQWQPAEKLRLDGGLRFEYEQRSESMFLSPRASAFWNLGKKDELTLGSGLFSQNDVEYYVRFRNPNILSEKAFHLNAEWDHHFSRDWRLEWQNYYKHYWDLVVPTLDNTGYVSLEGGLQLVNRGGELDNLNAEGMSLISELFGERRFNYHNRGLGHVWGSELSLFYDPHPRWGGWFSLEFSKSIRQDKEGERWYDFARHRPWAVNLVNYFRLPGRKYELAVRGKWAAGFPYTAFGSPPAPKKNAAPSDTLFYIEPINLQRYSRYARVDFKLTRYGTLWGHPFEPYFSVWNIFYEPNFILRDAKTEEFKFVDFNFPFPIVFLGMSYRW